MASARQQADIFIFGAKLATLSARLEAAGVASELAMEVVDQAFRIGCDVAQRSVRDGVEAMVAAEAAEKEKTR